MVRVLMLTLDGFDIDTARHLTLPTLERLANTAAHAHLDSGDAYRTGLTGEQLSNGLHPAAGGRRSAISFDPHTYTVTQEVPPLPPAFGGVGTVLFDPGYVDLDRTPETVCGITDWGAHDPGAPSQHRPDDLRDEIIERFGDYPARPWRYGFPWPTADGCHAMADDLVRAVQVRSAIARWMLTERFRDWQLAVVTVAEGHSASEGFFHGVDPDHPLAGHESASAARAGMRSVYQAIDMLVAELVEALPDVVTMVFSPHGMGTNNHDVASMLLLGELLARWSGQQTPDLSFPVDDHGLAVLDADDSWNDAVWRSLDGRSTSGSLGNLPRRIRSKVRAVRRRSTAPGLDWMPVVRHQRTWPTMRAFALPSYHDGRVRVNLRGREAHGLVDPAEYQSVLDDVDTLLRQCRDPRTGDSLVQGTERPYDDPFTADDDGADLIVHWNGAPVGLVHDELGQIGPVPWRQSGGHTSPRGAVFITGPGIEPADLGERSPFDLLPTAFELTNCPSPWPLSGQAFAVPTTA